MEIWKQPRKEMRKRVKWVGGRWNLSTEVDPLHVHWNEFSHGCSSALSQRPIKYVYVVYILGTRKEKSDICFSLLLKGEGCCVVVNEAETYVWFNHHRRFYTKTKHATHVIFNRHPPNQVSLLLSFHLAPTPFCYLSVSQHDPSSLVWLKLISLLSSMCLVSHQCVRLSLDAQSNGSHTWLFYLFSIFTYFFLFE